MEISAKVLQKSGGVSHRDPGGSGVWWGAEERGGCRVILLRSKGVRASQILLKACLQVPEGVVGEGVAE